MKEVFFVQTSKRGSLSVGQHGHGTWWPSIYSLAFSIGYFFFRIFILDKMLGHHPNFHPSIWTKTAGKWSLQAFWWKAHRAKTCSNLRHPSASVPSTHTLTSTVTTRTTTRNSHPLCPGGWYCWWQPEIRRENQLWLVVGNWNPMVLEGFYTSQVVGNGISEPSTVAQEDFAFWGFFFLKDDSLISSLNFSLQQINLKEKYRKKNMLRYESRRIHLLSRHDPICFSSARLLRPLRQVQMSRTFQGLRPVSASMVEGGGRFDSCKNGLLYVLFG